MGKFLSIIGSSLLFVLERELVNHSDKGFVHQLLDNLRQGCAISYSGPQFTLTALHLPSAFQQPSFIDCILQKEIEAYRIIGPFNNRLFKYHCDALPCREKLHHAISSLADLFKHKYW